MVTKEEFITQQKASFVKGNALDSARFGALIDAIADLEVDATVDIETILPVANLEPKWSTSDSKKTYLNYRVSDYNVIGVATLAFEYYMVTESGDITKYEDVGQFNAGEGGNYFKGFAGKQGAIFRMSLDGLTHVMLRPDGQPLLLQMEQQVSVVGGTIKRIDPLSKGITAEWGDPGISGYFTNYERSGEGDDEQLLFNHFGEGPVNEIGNYSVGVPVDNLRNSELLPEITTKMKCEMISGDGLSYILYKPDGSTLLCKFDDISIEEYWSGEISTIPALVG